jgi:hypothetical protein
LKGDFSGLLIVGEGREEVVDVSLEGLCDGRGD